MQTAASYSNIVHPKASPGGSKAASNPFDAWWLCAIVVVISSGKYFFLLEHTRLLQPIHHDFGTYVGAAIAVGVFSAVVAMTEPGRSLKARLIFGTILVLLGSMAGAEVAVIATKVSHEMADFPRAATTASVENWPIEKVYTQNSSGRDGATLGGRYVVTAYDRFKISALDFDKLGVLRRYEYANSPTVAPRGNFCVRVPVQTSGNAVRIMVGPYDELPTGSVSPCSEGRN